MGQLKMRREKDGFWVVGADKEVFSDSYVVIPSTYMGSPVIGISDNAFVGFEYIEKFIIEEGVQKIGRGAFYRCFNLDEVFLPESIKEIGRGAFDFCYNLRYEVPVCSCWTCYGNLLCRRPYGHGFSFPR